MKRSRNKKEENEKETITCTNESKLKTDSDNSGEKAAMLLRLGFESHDDSWKLPKTATQKKQKNPRKRKQKIFTQNKISKLFLNQCFIFLDHFFGRFLDQRSWDFFFQFFCF